LTDKYWCQTYTGEAFYYEDDKIATNPYKLEDIAHHLALINRFGGGTIYPYSVAQHSVALSVAVWDDRQNPWLCLDALFHDAEEVYLGDIRLPMKDRCPEFRAMSAPIDAAIRKAMNDMGIPVPLTETPIVRALDRRILINERGFVMQPSKHKWYALEGEEGIPNLPPMLFEQMDWRAAKKKWLQMLETYLLLIKSHEGVQKYALR